MRRKILIIGLMLLPAVGCSSMNNTETGLLGGAAVGTALGALVGRGRPGAMVAGGAVGAAVGGIAGSNQDRREENRAAVTAAVNAQAARQMSLNEVVQMSQQNTSEQVIINQIETTRSNFALRSEDILYLKQQGVSDRVIQVMQTPRYSQPVVIRQPVVYGPPPPPPAVVVVEGPYRRW